MTPSPMKMFRRSLALLAALAIVGVLAADASARGGGGGGGGGRGGMGGGRGGMGGGRGGMGGRMGGGRMGGRTGGMGGGPGGGGFGMRGNRNGTNGKTAKEWEVLQGIEERKAQIQQRRERLMDLDRKLQQEGFLASVRLERAVGPTMLAAIKGGATR